MVYFVKPVKLCVFSLFNIQSGLLFTTITRLYLIYLSAVNILRFKHIAYLLANCDIIFTQVH